MPSHSLPCAHDLRSIDIRNILIVASGELFSTGDKCQMKNGKEAEADLERFESLSASALLIARSLKDL